MGARDGEDGQQQPGGVFLATSELGPEAGLLPFPNTKRLGPALPGLCLMQSCLGKSEAAGATGSELY